MSNLDQKSEMAMRLQLSRTSRRVSSYDSDASPDISRNPFKSIQSFIQKRRTYEVVKDGYDVTPYNLPDSRYMLMEDVFIHAVFESKSHGRSELQVASKISTENLGINIYATTLDLDDVHIDYTINTESGVTYDDALLEQAPSAFYLPMMKPLTAYPPQFSVTLKETPTTILFALPSYSYEKGTQEANDIEAENEVYLYMTMGKGRNRKTITTETQTQEVIAQSRHTMAKKPQKQNASSFASVWDMHDTYAALSKPQEEIEDDEMIMYQTVAPELLRKKLKKETAEAMTITVLIKNPRFRDALVLTERVLANNSYIRQQKIYRGLVPFNPLSLDLVYIYTIHELWVFCCEDVAGMSVMDLSFNQANENIIAVAYGKFLYADPSRGAICIWCSKNPRKPERLYRFNEPATALEFSTNNPNWLACGFDNGDVMILDITSYDKRIIAKSKRDTNPSFEPMWVVTWRTSEDSLEYVMTTCQDGRIGRFTSTKTHDLLHAPMMRVTQVEGKIRGVYTVQPCLDSDVPILRYPAALCYARHPSKQHVYFIGTDEGCVHKCSINFLNQHMDVFRAHVGPVYDIQFSPFWKSVMVTCGADWAIRLWMEGIDEPIVTMNCSSPVYGITWSPCNSSVLVSVSGNLLCVWDIRRKAYVPCKEYVFPATTVLTYVMFSRNGETIIVADNEGQIHTLDIQDMPIAPFYQKQILEESIGKILSTRPQIARQVEKLEKFRSTQRM